MASRPRAVVCMSLRPSRYPRHLPVSRTVMVAFSMLLLARPARGQELMPAGSAAWTSFAARPDTTPAVLAATGSPYALEVSGNGLPNVYGGWRTRLVGLSSGQYYRFRSKALVQDIASPRQSVT